MLLVEISVFVTCLFLCCDVILCENDIAPVDSVLIQNGSLPRAEALTSSQGCDNIVISGTTSHYRQEGTYRYLFDGCSLSRRVYYKSSGGYYLYYFYSSASTTAVWAVSDIACSSTGYIVASSTASFPESVTGFWQEVTSTGSGFEYRTRLQVACKGDQIKINCSVMMIMLTLMGFVMKLRW